MTFATPAWPGQVHERLLAQRIVMAQGVLDGEAATRLCAQRLSGPALGVLAACGRRRGYPSAVLELTEPRLRLRGPVSAMAAHEQQARLLADALWERIAAAAGREAGEVRADAARHLFLTVPQAIDYGLLTEQAEASR